MNKTETYMGKGNYKTCDFCGGLASYDGKTKSGPWAYMCGSCAGHHSLGVGTGVGQRLIYEDKPTGRSGPEVGK